MRKRKPKVREIKPDPRYKNVMVSRFVNHLMWAGKKSTAYDIFYDAMDIIKDRTEEEDELSVWRTALDNITPAVELRSRRVGGANFQIPVDLPAGRKISIGMKWLIKFSRKRSGRGMADKLASEIIAASKGEGAAVKRKEDTHKMAESNRAFASYR